MSIVLTEYAEIQLVIDAKQPAAGVAGVLNGAKIIWAVADFAPSPTLAVAGITQSADAGLAPAAVTFGTAVRDSAGDIVSLTGEMPLQLALSVNTTQVYGYGLTNTAGSQLLASERFATPLNLVDNLTYYGVIVPYAPGGPDAKSAIIVS